MPYYLSVVERREVGGWDGVGWAIGACQALTDGSEDNASAQERGGVGAGF